MKHKNIHILVFLLVLSRIFVSCEKDIVYQASDEPSLGVMYSFPMEDSILKVHLSKSTNILGNNVSDDIHDAIITVYDNGKLLYSGPYSPDNDWMSVSNVITKPNHFYSIVGKLDNNHEISSKTEVPEPVQISGVEFDVLVGDEILDLPCEVLFNDPPSEENYYQLRVDVIRWFDNFSENQTIVYEKDDKVFFYLETDKDILFDVDYQGTFTDYLIDGSQYSLKLTIPNEYLSPQEGQIKTELKYYLYSLTEDYFKYIRSSIAEDLHRENMFYEHQNIFTNINGGVGVVAGLSFYVYNVEL